MIASRYNYRGAPKRQMVVKGLMGAGELTFTHGPAKSGKSFLMTSCGLAVAEGVESWWGHRIKRPGQVLYLVQEGAGGFPMRLDAWSRTHGRPVPDRFVWTSARLSFVADGSRGAAVQDVRRVAELVATLEQETGEPVVLIIIDTAARVTAGADENSAAEMGMFLEACAVLQDLSSRPHVNVVAHDNAAGTRMRGSTARQGGGDGLIHVERAGDTRSWCLETAKDDVETEKRGFALETVELGTDEDGDLVTSCVVVEAEAPEKAEQHKGPPLTPKQRTVLECLSTAIVDHGEAAPPSHDIHPKVRVARFGMWEAVALRHTEKEGGEEEPAELWRQRGRFKRIVDALQAKGLIKRADGWCWLSDAGAQTAAQFRCNAQAEAGR